MKVMLGSQNGWRWAVRSTNNSGWLIHECLLLQIVFCYEIKQIFSAEARADKKMDEYVAKYDALRLDTASIITDIDKELNEHFSLRQ